MLQRNGSLRQDFFQRRPTLGLRVLQHRIYLLLETLLLRAETNVGIDGTDLGRDAYEAHVRCIYHKFHNPDAAPVTGGLQDGILQIIDAAANSFVRVRRNPSLHGRLCHRLQVRHVGINPHGAGVALIVGLHLRAYVRE